MSQSSIISNGSLYWGMPSSMIPRSLKLIKSDIKINNLNSLLRIWVSQLVENALEHNATYIEVRFYCWGINGFDVIDDG